MRQAEELDSQKGDYVARHVFVSGLVQGVGFRWYTLHEAKRRHLGGWVRNRYDGRVEVVICGLHEDVASMLNWLRVGPPSASVSSIEVEEAEDMLHEFDMLATI